MTNTNLTPNKSIVNNRSDLRTFDGLLSMEVTYEMVQEIEAAKFAWQNLIVQGHMVVICAKPNGGKTTLMVHAASEMAKAGYDVMYINADAAGSEIREYAEHAYDFGYRLINPDITNGSAEKVINELKTISQKNDDFSRVVIILDTLKKFAELMQKTKAKELFSLFRKLTAKGMTIICLAHTNKYDDADGKPVFEGVGDVRSDFDELIYLIPAKNSDGSITISTCIDKNRSTASNKSFRINVDREVEVLPDHIDTLALSKYHHDLENDADVISFILENIKYQSKSVTDLYALAQDQKTGFSRKRIDTVAKRYSTNNCNEPKWLSMKAATYGYRYGLISNNYADRLKMEYCVKV